MPNNPPIQQYGTITYQNSVNNWRAEDIDFLADRVMVRYRTEAEATSGNSSIGALAFISDNASDNPGNDPDTPITVGASPRAAVRTATPSGSAWKTLLASEYLTIPTTADSSTAVSIRHKSTPSSGGISVQSDGSVTAPTTLRVGTSTVLTSGVITLTGGGVTGTLSVSPSPSRLVTNLGVSAPSITISGIAQLSTVTVSGSLSVPTMAATTVAVASEVSSDTVVASGKITAGSIESLSSIKTGVLSLDGTIASPKLATSAGTAYVQLTGDRMDLFATNGIYFRRNMSQTPVWVAGSVVSTSPPPSGSASQYPSGTIWFEVA